MSKRLHVLLVSAWYPAPDEPVYGLFVRDQARAASLGCEVTVLARAAPGAPRDSTENGVRVLRVLPTSGAGLIANLRRLAAMTAAVRRLRREGRPPDLVHGHVYYAAFLALLLGRLHGLPVIVSEHYSGIAEQRLSLRDMVLARITFRYADLVCPVSTMLEQSLVGLEPRGRYVVVRNAVDVEAFARVARPGRAHLAPHLMTVTRLLEVKGIPYLLEALRLLLREHPDVHLDIVGHGPDRQSLESAAGGLPVAFLGERSREEVVALMEHADVLVMPSLVETFGIAPLEALAAGLPVVATSAFPVADVIAELGGSIVPPADSLALAEAITGVLAGRSRVRADAASEIRRRFGIEATGERWEMIYRDIVAERSRAKSVRPRARRSA